MSTPLPPAKVSEATFLGLLWAGTAVSLCFLLFRLFVRIKSYRKLHSDDFLVIAAWGMLLAYAIIWQIKVPILYEQYGVESGQERMRPGFADRDASLLHSFVPLTVLFYSCLWTVKLSFLFFFRRLGSKVRGHKIWWWCILVITVLTWVACIADIHYRCTLGSFESIISYCPSLAAIHYENRTFYANCAADVITDCLIISLPVLMLWNVRIPLRQKSILMAIFSVTAVIMIVSVVRVAVVNKSNENTDISWLYLWSSIEMATSVIVSCIASFRQLFVTAQNQHQYRKPGESTTRKGLFSYFRSKSKSTNDSGPHVKWPTPRRGYHGLQDKTDSRTHIVPLHSINVKHNIETSNTASHSKIHSAEHYNIAQGVVRNEGSLHDGALHQFH